MKVLAVIPARYQSTRLPGKPLLDIAGMSMIRRVYLQCMQSQVFEKVIIATDDARIEQECILHGMDYQMTASTHQNGSERCAEVLNSIENSFDLVVNVQGDEPFIHPNSFEEIVAIFQQQPQAKIGTLVKIIKQKSDVETDSIIKVVFSKDKKALYFSRSAIPYLREITVEEGIEKQLFYKHIGMYAFKPEILKALVQLPESLLESYEKLEQLRWLENGYEIYINQTNHESKSVDTEADYHYILENIESFTNTTI
jgi:3-deoxy-manno-octulosonate cytidylyltransferase (CMP-KDO synthetase)